MIVKFEKSPLPTKRFRVTMDDGKHFDFGFRNPLTGELGSTYIDHKDKTKRDNYRKRHLANPTEKKLNDNLVPSASLMSIALLWGRYDNVKDNIVYLNNLWAKKHKK